MEAYVFHKSSYSLGRDKAVLLPLLFYKVPQHHKTCEKTPVWCKGWPESTQQILSGLLLGIKEFQNTVSKLILVSHQNNNNLWWPLLFPQSFKSLFQEKGFQIHYMCCSWFNLFYFVQLLSLSESFKADDYLKVLSYKQKIKMQWHGSILEIHVISSTLVKRARELGEPGKPL